MPIPNIQPMIGIYVIISCLTPLLDVKVDAPVKFKQIKAVIDGRINIYGIAMAKLNQL